MQSSSKSHLFRVAKTANESFNVQKEGNPFYPLRHYHPEIQITLIAEGTGTRFIGNSVATFQEGDIFIIGSNVPHMFRNSIPNETGHSVNSNSLSIYLKPEVMGTQFFNMPETRRISDLLVKASRGIELNRPETIALEKMFHEIYTLKGFHRLQKLFEILHQISISPASRSISQLTYVRPIKDHDNRRLSDVFDFIFNNYSNEIKLDQVSGIANLSTPAFCRYFKLHTRQTFTRFLNHVRIEQASRMLTESSRPISEIGFLCGYKNIPYFNREFKKITGLTPMSYRKDFGR